VAGFAIVFGIIRRSRAKGGKRKAGAPA